MNDIPWILKVADKFYDTRNYERAGFYYEKAGKGDESYLKIAKAALNKRDYDTAILYFDKVGVIEDYYDKLAEGFFNKKDYDKAALYYEKINPPKYIYSKLANAYFSIPDYNKAAVYFDKADSSRFEYLKLAIAFFKAKQYDQAGKYFVKADAYKTHYKKLADAYKSAGFTGKANIYYDRVKDYIAIESKVDIPHLQAQAERAYEKSKEVKLKGNMKLMANYSSLSEIYLLRRDIENNPLIKLARNTGRLNDPATINTVDGLVDASPFFSMARAIDLKLDEIMVHADKNGFVWDANIQTVKVETRIHNANALLLMSQIGVTTDPEFASIPNIENSIKISKANVDYVNREIFADGLFTQIRGFSNSGQRALKQAEKSLDDLLNQAK